MLVPNANIWDTRLQTVGALVTAAAGEQREVYYLATACAVGIDPPLLSISPNPEYPICDLIAHSGRFGIHYLAEEQDPAARACMALDPHVPDKIGALGLRVETSDHGTPLLMDCLQALECRVTLAWDSGDHRTIIGQVEQRIVRSAGGRPQRYFDTGSTSRRVLKELAVRSRIYDALLIARRVVRRAPDIREGTQSSVRNVAH